MTPTNSILPRQNLFPHDHHRPRYHFLPESKWMNDPNGAIQWEGEYHLFYQHNPNGPLWGDIHWGHAVSKDLIHWTDWPMALAPTPGGPDETGVFSGCAVNNNGQPMLIYTGTRGARHEIQTQCIATSDDGLVTWKKYDGNPVISEVPAESGQSRDFRDPFVWKEGAYWYMVLGSRINEAGGAVFLYRSTNLTAWEYLNPLLTGDIKESAVIWECPNFFKLGDKWVLIISAHFGTATGSVLYYVGDYANQRFTPASQGVLDFDSLYAPLSFLDDSGQRVMYGWLRETRPAPEQSQAGWSGVQAIPRVLGLDSQNRLTMKPVEALKSIRGQAHHVGTTSLNGEQVLAVRGQALDIEARFAPAADGAAGLKVLCAEDESSYLNIQYDAATQRLIIRNVVPDFGQAVIAHVREIPHVLAAGELLELRVLVDGSVVEIIVNERTSVTSRVYPSRSDSNQVRLWGKQTELRSLDIWEMPSIW